MVLKKHYSGHSAGDEVRWFKDGKLSSEKGVLKGYDEKTLELVDKIVKAYYRGIHANLALIEITLYNHCILKRRNHHKSFVSALIKRGTIQPKTERELRNLTSGISKKMNGLPDVFYDERSLCKDIGKMLGSSFPLRR